MLKKDYKQLKTFLTAMLSKVTYNNVRLLGEEAGNKPKTSIKHKTNK